MSFFYFFKLSQLTYLQKEDLWLMILQVENLQIQK